MVRKNHEVPIPRCCCTEVAGESFSRSQFSTCFALAYGVLLNTRQQSGPCFPTGSAGHGDKLLHVNTEITANLQQLQT